MTNLEKYSDVFLKTFETNIEKIESLKYQAIPEWDSVGHMRLVAALEDEFGIMLDTDDIIDFSSYKNGIEILKKYGMAIE